MPNSKAIVSGDFSGLIKSAENAAKSVLDLGLKLSGLSTAAKGINIATSALGDTVTMLGKLGLAANGLEAIGKSAAAMSMGLLEGNAALEMTTVSFTTLLGSASAANKEIQDLTKFAAATPFNLPGLESATQRLLAAGYASADIIPLMTSLGDSISALGGSQDQLNSLVYVFGQMRNEAKLNAGDIAQMSNLGIPALQMLADHYGTTTSAIQEMITKGLIPGKDAAAIFATEMEKRYGGMMAAQSATFSGMISNLQDWYSATLRILTKPLFEPAKAALASFLNYVQSPAGVAAINKLAGYVQAGVDRITKLFKELLPQIEPFFKRILDTADGIKSQLIPVVDALIPRLEKLWSTFEPIASVILKTAGAFSPLTLALTTLKGFFTGGLDGAVTAFDDRMKFIEGVVRNGATAINSLLKTLATKISDNIGIISNAVRFYGTLFVNWVVPAGKELLTTLGNILGAVLKWIAAQAPAILEKLKSWATSFVDWLIPVAGSLIQKAGEVLKVILNWIEAHATEILDQLATWAEALAAWILPMIPQIIESLSGVLNKIILWVATKAPAVLTALLKWGLQFVNWIKPMIGQVMQSMQQLISVLLNWIAQNAPTIINEVLGWAKAFLSWIDPLIPVLINALARIISSITNWISENAATIVDMVLGWVNQFVTGFGTLLPGILQALGAVIRGVLDWISANGPAILGQLLDWGQQFLNWIGPMIPLVLNALGQLITKLVQWVDDHGPAILDMLVNWAVQFMNWAFQLFDRIKPNLESFISKILKWLVERGPELLDRLWGWIKESINMVEELFTFIKPVLFELVGKLGDWVKNNAKDILDKLWGFLKLGLNMATELITYITPVLTEIVTKIGEWIRDHAKEILDNLWSFLKAGLNLASELFKSISPVLEDIIVELGKWIGTHAKEILDKLWSFLQAGLNLATDLFKKLEPVLVDIFNQMGQWFKDHGKEIMDKLWEWVQIAVDTGILFYDHIRPMLESLTNQMGDYLYQEASSIIDQLTAGLMNWLKNSDLVTVGENVGRFLLTGLMNSPFFAALNVATGGALKRLLGLSDNDAVLKPLKSSSSSAPKKASGDSNWRGGLVEVGEQGMELIRLAGAARNNLLLATGPTLANLPRGTQIFNNRETMAMLPNPASAQQIHNMYNANRTSSWDYSQTTANSNNTINHNYFGQSQPAAWSPGQQYKWYGGR